MFRWFFYDDSIAESPRDDGPGGDRRWGGAETKEAENRRQGGHAEDDSDSETEVGPLLDDLDPSVAAAILTQAAFRGYRLRDRLRHLPAREAEKTIRALHANARGFRSLGLFIIFFGLYFSLVFGGADVTFQRSVRQGLRNHLALVRFGPEGDRSHMDVTSLSDVYQWMQMFYLKTYHGTQLENVCTACIIKPSDDVCDTCDFDLYDANFPETDLPYVDRTASSIGQGRRRAATSSSGTSSSSSSSSSLGLSEECQACVVGRACQGTYVNICAAFLDSGSISSPEAEEGDATDDLPSSTSSTTSTSNTSVELTLNTTALDAIVLEPVGGVTAAGGYLFVENVSQCDGLHDYYGTTENLGRFQADLKVPYDGIGLVADRNKIIGGMLVTFSRRKRLSSDQCSSSLDYFDVCLADAEDKETIIPGEGWGNFRPDPDIVYSDVADGYPILIDTGGFNVGLNLGLCTLLMMEDLEVIPPEEVKKVSVQLITYNGNQKSAYGSIFIDFKFDDGGTVIVTETVIAYVLRNNVAGSGDRKTWISTLLFVTIFIGMARYDTKKWFRLRRAKANGNRCHCVCGFMFFVLIFLNIMMWMAWSFALTNTISFETDFQDSSEGEPALKSISRDIVALYEVALFVSAYYSIFLLTTMAGLYRWIFKMLTFHKRMSIVTDTLSRASSHLDHFLFVIFLVVLVFANLTWLLVGSSSEEFFTLEEAWRSVIRVTLGEAENFFPQILEAQPTVGPVIVVLYQVLGVVLLLNVVIAMLLEAYREVVGSMHDEDTIFQSLTAFIGMTLCVMAARIRWCCSYVRWWLSEGRSRRERRPSLKVALQGSTGVYGVDGRPVLMIRKSDGLARQSSDRQLSYNCRRYITVTEMQALIEAAPVPAFVADRLVRKIVNNWIFRSTESNTREKMAAAYSGGYGASSGSRDGSIDTMPMLRRRDSIAFGSR